MGSYCWSWVIFDHDHLWQLENFFLKMKLKKSEEFTHLSNTADCNSNIENKSAEDKPD